MARRKQPPKVPSTPSQRTFARWISGERGRQKALADESGIPQQSLSNYALRVSRPDVRRAMRIEAAIRRLGGGECPADGWMTAAERREQATYLGRAA